MPTPSRSLLSLDHFSPQQIRQYIDTAVKLKNGTLKPRLDRGHDKVIGLAFFEPSTRTQVSFEIAAHRLGLRPITFVGDGSTSIAKGETLHETLSTLLAMRPDLLVIRYGNDNRITEVLLETPVPVINAGSGVQEHPTQALLDAMTIIERKGRLDGQKIVYIGDVEHSRVARSGRALFEKFGAEVAVCAPPVLMPTSADWSWSRRFDRLDEALQWSTVAIGLRLQKERHGDRGKVLVAEYVENFRLDKRSLGSLSADGLLMHPGPFLPEVDLHEEILTDSRCAIREQVTNGVFVRMAVMGELLGLSYT